MINDWLVNLGLNAWRPLLGALLMPPTPLLGLILLGAWQVRKRAWLGWGLVLLGTVGVWATQTHAFGQALRETLLPPVRALSAAEIKGLRAAPNSAIVVLGGGRNLRSPEYMVPDLRPLSIERLRYGAWLAKQTQLPLMFSGGVAHGASPGPTEADIAAHVSERDFHLPLRWRETTSHDTRENAFHSVALLRAQGITQIIVVTHGYHMPRTLRNFERAVQSQGGSIKLVAAPTGVVQYFPPKFADFLPSRLGATETSYVLHEWLGLLGGA